MGIRGICFDIDGTLYPFWMTRLCLVPTFFPSLRIMYEVRKFRNHVREEGYEHPAGEGEDSFLSAQAEFVLSSTGQEVTPLSIGRMKSRIEKQLYNRMAYSFRRVRPFPYLGETLQKLTGEHDLVLSALSDFPVSNKLETLGVAEYFPITACAQETGYLKPHPAPFLHIAEKMALKPEEILYVGDSYRKDIEGAKGVGMKTVLLLNSLRGTNEREKFAVAHPSADLLFHDYRDFYHQVTGLISSEE